MNYKKRLKPTIFIAILFAIWFMISELEIVSPYILPTPKKVAESFYKMTISGEIFEDIYISYIRVLKGFFIAILLAFVLAMIRIIRPKWNDYYEFVLQFMKNVPPLSLISLLILKAKCCPKTYTY